MRGAIVWRLCGAVLFLAVMQGASARPYPFVVVVPQEMQKYFTRISPPREVPYQVKRNGWSGTGTCRVNVDARGRVTRAAVVKTTGYRVLDEALIAGIRTWRARPGKQREIDFLSLCCRRRAGCLRPGCRRSAIAARAFH